MNASSWKKAVDLVAKAPPVNPQVQVAVMAESQQLESLPLSALSIDDSRPPQVTYDSQQPIATKYTKGNINSNIRDTHRGIPTDTTRYE